MSLFFFFSNIFGKKEYDLKCVIALEVKYLSERY